MELEDRRVWPRIAYFEDVVAYANQRRLRCRSLDLGAGGMALRAPHDELPPDELRINIRLEEGQTVVVDASVVERSRADDARPVWNLRFVHVPRPIRGRIAAYVAQRAINALADKRASGEQREDD